eukprot:scaffold349_cov237-Ochromonas_danica.AAC.1
MGYVEQFDTLHQYSTPREAIAFAAALRLSPKITTEQREKWVNAVLNMMDLEPLQNDLIGPPSGGMSFEQRKRISIATELVANPSILFLDEPTTGLDSCAAQSLVANIRRIAASGRNIVCTIHQPSTAIFNAFDRLLLLMRGGLTVYFGPLGEDSVNLVHYFQSAPGVQPMPIQMNPATWMLEVIGAGTSTEVKNNVDFHAFYVDSSLCTAEMAHLDTLMQPNAGSNPALEEELQDDHNHYNAS